MRFSIKQNGKSKNVCLRCYEFSKTSTANKNPEQRKNISILDKPVENETENVILQPTQKPDLSINSVLSPDDQIRKRLAALKLENRNSENEASTSTAVDIEKRLAALKGIDYKDYTESNKQFLNQRDNRTQEEQVHDLMKQFAEEQDIHDTVSNYRLAGVEEIEKRLAQLRGSPENNENRTIQPAELPEDEYEKENEEDTVNKLTKRFLEEAAIDVKKNVDDEDELNNLDIPDPLNPSDLEELPWCTICNEDAVVRCVNCDGELFCNDCFQECHKDDEEYKVHKTKPYKVTSEPKN